MKDKSEFYMFIDGKWVKSYSGRTIDVINPANNKIIARVPCSERRDVRWSIEAADKSFKIWSKFSCSRRAEIMHKTADLIRKRYKSMAKLLTREQGKPLREAEKEMMTSAQSIDYFAEEGKRCFSGEVLSTDDSSEIKSLVIKQPIGVVGVITPWNYPMNLPALIISSALTAGCTVVLKPASLTPLSSIKLVECFVDAGIPDGVLNLVIGPGGVVGDELVTNPTVKKISFTGESATGKEIMRKASLNLKPLTLELGGNCPLIVCGDGDLKNAVDGGIYRSFHNMGQICNSINRIYVEKEVADDFIEMFVDKAKKLKIGNGMEQPDADLGPMINDNQRQVVKQHVQDAISKGARILFGGKEPEGSQFKKGFFFEPTVLVDVDHNMRIMKEETFGPVAPIMVVENANQALELANDSKYGLVAYIYTENINNAVFMADYIKCGTIDINNVIGGDFYSPYGGWKESGLGVELSHYGLNEYLNMKHIRIKVKCIN